MLRFPLYLKLLVWFFLNLALIVLIFFLVLHAQTRLGLDWLLSERVDATAALISSELGNTPPSEWNSILAPLEQEYHGKVRFLIYNEEGQLLAGPFIILPDEVRQQMERRGPHPGPESPTDGGPPPPLRNGPPQRFMHTGSPSLYWVVQRLNFRPRERRPPPLRFLVAVSSSLTGGGFFFSIQPWMEMGAGAVLLSILFWFPLVRDVNRSIGQLTAAAHQIALGRFETRVPQTRRDELGSLAQAINQMAARLNDLVTGQKRFLGDVAHELCAPLAKLRVSLGILEQKAGPGQKPYLDGAEEEAAHMAGLVNELLSFSKTSLTAAPALLRPVFLHEVVQKAVHRESDPAAQIVNTVDTRLQVMADAELLTRALANLLRNAVRYAGQAGPITIAAVPQIDEIHLTVTDCGPGVPEAELARIFDPFYRLDESRDRATGGTGLGLAIVKTCVEACQGTVTGRNRVPSGLEICLTLRAVSSGLV